MVLVMVRWKELTRSSHTCGSGLFLSDTPCQSLLFSSSSIAPCGSLSYADAKSILQHAYRAARRKGGIHPRWEHIQSLLEGNTPSEWREAIIEADIMLDDVLAKRGYEGDGVGEKLKSANKESFGTLQNAWEAHKVRNLIAHQGSSFDLSESIASAELFSIMKPCSESLR